MEWTLAITILVVVAIGVFFAGRRGSGDSTGKLDQIINTQAELSGRVQQSESSLNERLETLSKRVGEGLFQHTKDTGEHLKGLHERLAVIDTAQKNIAELSSQVVGLQDVLSSRRAAPSAITNSPIWCVISCRPRPTSFRPPWARIAVPTA